MACRRNGNACFFKPKAHDSPWRPVLHILASKVDVTSLGINHCPSSRMPFVKGHCLKGYYLHFGPLVQALRVQWDLNETVGVDHGVDKP